VSVMPRRAATSPLVPSTDSTVYLVLDCATDLHTLVSDLLSSRYRRPLRGVAFDTVDGGTRDVTAEIAREVLSRALELDRELPAALRDFLERRVCESRMTLSADPKPLLSTFVGAHTPVPDDDPSLCARE
jgi:hypothetical protein